MIQQRRFAVDGFGNGVFGIATEDDVILAVFLDDGGGANVEVRDGWIGAGKLRSVKCAKDVGLEFGIGDERLGIRGKLPCGRRGIVLRAR